MDVGGFSERAAFASMRPVQDDQALAGRTVVRHPAMVEPWIFKKGRNGGAASSEAARERLSLDP